MIPENTLAHTKKWFEQAVPNPTLKNKTVQFGVHLEEVGEMARAVGEHELAEHLERLALGYKTGPEGFGTIDHKELLDALCDQIVTAVGVAHMFGLDIKGAMVEVNRSNFSKFVDGEPVFNEHGKIVKGPFYMPPHLTPFVGDAA